MPKEQRLGCERLWFPKTFSYTDRKTSPVTIWSTCNGYVVCVLLRAIHKTFLDIGSFPKFESSSFVNMCRDSTKNDCVFKFFTIFCRKTSCISFVSCWNWYICNKYYMLRLQRILQTLLSQTLFELLTKTFFNINLRWGQIHEDDWVALEPNGLTLLYSRAQWYQRRAKYQ